MSVPIPVCITVLRIVKTCQEVSLVIVIVDTKALPFVWVSVIIMHMHMCMHYLGVKFTGETLPTLYSILIY